MTGGFAGLDLASHLDRPAEEQELFGQGCFTGVWVADNTEGAALFYFLLKLVFHWFSISFPAKYEAAILIVSGAECQEEEPLSVIGNR